VHGVRHVELSHVEHAIAHGVDDLRLPGAVVVVHSFVTIEVRGRGLVGLRVVLDPNAIVDALVLEDVARRVQLGHGP